MAPTAAQFSPGQILEAGRRAETDGRAGYAIQFYRHLTDHHGWSPEAAIAKEALVRLANFRPANDVAPASAPLQQGSAGQPAGPHHPTMQAPNWGPAPQPGAGSGSAGYGPASGPPMAYPAVRAPNFQAVPGAAAVPPLRLPEAERRYRLGSVVAWLLFGLGLLLMTASLGLMGMVGAGIKLPGTLGTMLGFTGGLPGALAIFAVGVMQVFAAQMGRALFDMANAARDLAMIERAKIAYAAGDQPFSDDED
jgi:hypothetical protein